MANYIKLEWSNTCNLGRIYYAGDFKNRLFFEADIGKPEYEEEIEEEKNSDGVPIATFQSLNKIYKFQVYVPEYVADALMAMALHDTITLTAINAQYTASIRNVKVDVDFEDMSNDCMALCTVSFQQDDQITKGSCC